MNAPLKSLLLVLGALGLAGFVALKTAQAGPSTVDPSGAKADSTDSIDLAGKHDGGHSELAQKHDGGGWIALTENQDPGAALEAVEKKDGGGGWVTLSEKKEGGSVELSAEKKEGGSVSIELAAKGDGGGWIALPQATH